MAIHLFLVVLSQSPGHFYSDKMLHGHDKPHGISPAWPASLVHKPPTVNSGSCSSLSRAKRVISGKEARNVCGEWTRRALVSHSLSDEPFSSLLPKQGWSVVFQHLKRGLTEAGCGQWLLRELRWGLLRGVVVSELLRVSGNLKVAASAAAKSLQSCPTLCDPIDGSTPGSPVPGVLQARTLEWVAISFSNA